MNLTAEQITETLKAVNMSITSLRRRLDNWDGSEAARQMAQQSHDTLVDARAAIEGDS